MLGPCAWAVCLGWIPVERREEIVDRQQEGEFTLWGSLCRLDLLKKISALRTEDDESQKVKRAEAPAEVESDARVQDILKIHSPPVQ